ncbi:hypothetical protein ABZX30_30235 [Streptomyces sp. NPDC004542]|uniref:hypothetical protein n=1 Tax=Streptomyces sp. NPDC004542 TaxID=3154281 RepID=UPI0033A76886
MVLIHATRHRTRADAFLPAPAVFLIRPAPLPLPLPGTRSGGPKGFAVPIAGGTGGS